MLSRRSVLAAALAGVATPPVFAAGPRTLKVMTYNIAHGKGLDQKVDLERTAKVIRDGGADLVALQEVDQKTKRTGGVDQAEKLGQLTGLHHAFGKAMDYQGGGYGLAILSRWPIGKTTLVPLPFVAAKTEPRALFLANIQIHDGPALAFASTHLEYSDRAILLHQTEIVLQHLGKADGLAIVAGDFNARPDSPAIALLKRSLASDSPDDHHTFRADKPDHKIDWVFRKGELRVIERAVVEEPLASDHRPVTVTYVL
jgi:endonuclease/exonuclease/phosphatase family metal-dependent hydrolase